MDSDGADDHRFGRRVFRVLGIYPEEIRKKDIKTMMLIGLAHDRIIYLGMSYIERGWITNDEYENLHDYLYKPYEQMGGNGAAKRIILL